MSIATTNVTLQRRQVVTEILAARKDELVVTGLGAPTWDVASVSEDQNNFYLWGGMVMLISWRSGVA